MTNLDEFVDAFEDAVATHGVLAVDLKAFSPGKGACDGPIQERSTILIELLRVWMEHRWRAGHPVTVKHCLSEFPDVQFSDAELQCLQFEEQRLRQTTERTSNVRSRSWTVDSLPKTGEMWGEFELLTVLGVGAFAKVYLARQHGLAGRLVAVKLTFRETDESHWLATLQHSAIVPIYSTHCHEHVYAICMPFLGNSTLADLLLETPKSVSSSQSNWWSRSKLRGIHGGSALLSTIQQRHEQIDTLVKTSGASAATEDRKPDSISNENRLTGSTSESLTVSPTVSSTSRNLGQCDYVDAICWIGLQLADALAYAHRNGVIHSDIKPANILLAFDGQPRLLDFNVAYKCSPDGMVGTELSLGGTIPYMSPEHRQALDRNAFVDGRSDLYSLGVVIYEMLTGRLPDKESRGVDPSKWNSAVSPAMSAIVRRCLENDPAHRYQSADALRDDLNAQFHREPLVHQAEPSSAERLLKWCYRHPRLSSSISIAAMASMLIAVLLTGVVARQIALDQADWLHRIDLLKERLPNSLAMLSSLDAAPDLESEVVDDLEKSLALIESPKTNPKQLDLRWDSSQSVNDDLRSDVRLLAWLSTQRHWKKPPEIPGGLLDKFDTDHVPMQDEQLRGPWTLIQARNFNGAIATLKKRVERNPRDYVGWWLLGDCYHSIQDLSNSQLAYTVCIALQPKRAIAYHNRGMTLTSASRFDDAEKDYQTVCELAPTWHHCRLNRAIALRQVGRIDEAIAELDVAIKAGYSTVSVHRLRGELSASRGDAEAAKLDFSRALQCEPVTDQHWIDRGMILLGSNPQLAAEDFERALTANPTSIAGHQKLAYVYSELLRAPEKGLEHSNRLVELLPNEPMHLAGRAVLHARAGRVSAALSDLRRLETKTVREPLVMYQVACAYSLLAGASKSEMVEGFSVGPSAFQWFAKAADVDPNIVGIALTDPDVQWMREQSRFQEIAKAVNTLKSPMSK